jgi:PAS domain S-box-containing protein
VDKVSKLQTRKPMLIKTQLPHISSEVFQEIFQGSAEGILIIDSEGIIKLANPVSERMFGYEHGELIGRQMEILIPKSVRKNHKHHRESFNKNPSPRRMGMGRDLLATRKDGSEFPVEVSLSFQKIGEQILVMAFVINITERKQAEEALRRSEEQLLVYAAELEKKVKVRTEELNKSVAELEYANRILQEQIKERKKAEEETRKALDKERELNELKTKFVSIASHEFRTPLSTVLSSASLVAQYKEKGDLEKIDKHILRIKSSVNHLTSILNDFLSLGRLEEGKIEVIKEPVMLSDFFKEIKEELKPILKDGQEIQVTCNLKEQSMETDRRLMRNILFNLISNASKYSDSGKLIYLECNKEDKSVIITVRDEGIGIPKNEVKHLFERFFRASNVTNIQGTGLGLNIVNRYVDLLKGKIDFSSIEGKGSTFKVIIPLT